MCGSAGTIATRLTGLVSDPSHNLASSQMRRFGFPIGLTLRDGETAERFINGCQMIRPATSFGGVHTSAERRIRWDDDVADGCPAFGRLRTGRITLAGAEPSAPVLKIRQPACKPGSVWPAPEGANVAAIPLGQTLLSDSSDLPGRRAGNRPGGVAPAAPSLFGLAPGGVCRAAHVAVRAVGSYPTLSPLPLESPCGASFRRFAFCGAFPGVAPAGHFPAPCFHGARTFLTCGVSHARPPGRLAGA